MYMSDGTCHTAMDTYDMDGVKYHLCLLFLGLPRPTHAHPSHVTSPADRSTSPSFTSNHEIPIRR